jgi:hypothetical protein
MCAEFMLRISPMAGFCENGNECNIPGIERNVLSE